MAFYFHILVAHSFVFKYCVLSLIITLVPTRYMIPFYYWVFFLYLLNFAA
jgi:hypothetical protein